MGSAALLTIRGLNMGGRLLEIRFVCGGGGRGIRTPGTVTRSVVFKTTAIDHSAIPPRFDFRRFLILHDRLSCDVGDGFGARIAGWHGSAFCPGAPRMRAQSYRNTTRYTNRSVRVALGDLEAF